MIEVRVSSIIPAQIDRVWAVVRDFNAMPSWHPLIAESRIEGGGPSDQIGCVRNFVLTDGSRIREKLLSQSDSEYHFSYTIVEAGLPLQNYTAGLGLHSVTDGDKTFGVWWAKFTTPEGMEEELEDTVSQGVFQAGFDSLKNRFV